jgi:hypothetical protein
MQAGAGYAHHSFIGVTPKIGRIVSDPALHVLPGVRAAIEEGRHPVPSMGTAKTGACVGSVMAARP